jgi:hypothetical protein
VALLVPRVQLDLPPGIVLHGAVLGQGHITCRRCPQGARRLVVADFLLQRLPLVKGWAVDQGQSGQQVAPVEFDRPIHVLHADVAVDQVAVEMGLLGGYLAGELDGIHPTGGVLGIRRYRK